MKTLKKQVKPGSRGVAAYYLKTTTFWQAIVWIFSCFCRRSYQYVLSFFLILFLFQTVFAVGEVVVDSTDASKTPQLTRTTQGVLQIDIVNSKNGLSHNRFENYDSNTKGIVINNSPYSDTIEDLGDIKANPNLNKPANAILFEITGDSGSELNGEITIFGSPAQLIVTNPNGIKCSNCSFVNSQKVELRSDKLFLITEDGRIEWIPNASHNILVGGSGPVVRNGSLLLSSGQIYLVAIQAKAGEREDSTKDLFSEAEQKSFLIKSGESIEKMGGSGNLYSDGDVFLESNSGLIEGGDLVAGGLVSVISEGDIRLSSAKSHGDIFLYAKDKLDAKEIDAQKNGDIKLYGKQIGIEKVSNAHDLIILGEELGRIKLSGIKNVEIVDKKLLPKIVSPSSQINEDNALESTMNFYIDAPTDIEGAFKFAGKNFVSKNTLNVKGDVILELSGILSNKESSDITVGGSWYSLSRRFGFVDKGQITADSIEIYLIEDNDKDNYKGIYIGADAELKTREGGGGILGDSVTLNANSLVWQNIYNKGESEQKSFGFDSGVLMSIAKIGSGESASRSGSVVNGWLSFSDYGSNKEGIIRATISKDAEINIGEKTDLSGLNRDESKMVEITRDDEYAYSIGIPIVDVKELRSRWEAKETLLQQMVGDKSLPERERRFAKAEQEISKEIKEEAIEEGLDPGSIKDVVEELKEERYAADNLEKLNEYYGEQEIPIKEIVEILEGREPFKDEKGEIKFTEAPKGFGEREYDVELGSASVGAESVIELKSEEHTTSTKNSGFDDESWKDEAGFDDMLDVITFGMGGAVIKVGGKVLPKEIRPTIKALKKLVGSKAKVEILKDATKSKIWTSTKARTAVENAYKHWEKHRVDFPEFANGKQYVEGIRKFFSNSPKGTLTKVRANGDIVKYHPKSNTFAIINKKGVPKTMYKPDPLKHGRRTNVEYFYDQ